MKIYELLNEPSKWTRYTGARDMRGNKISISSPDAVCWCLMGAVHKCYNLEEQEEILDKISNYLKPIIITDWNDNCLRTFEEVKSLCLALDI